MQRGHCGVGKRLYDLYQEKSLDLVVADTEKRLRMTGADHLEWLALARDAARLRGELEKARCDYLEHVVTCKICEWDQLAHSYPDAAGHPGPVSAPEWRIEH